MNIQIFGTTKCFDTKKAQRYFKERGIKFQMIDLKEKEMSRGEFENVSRALGGWQALVDPNAKDKQTLALLDALVDWQKEDKLFENQQLFRTPIVRNGRQATAAQHAGAHSQKRPPEQRQQRDPDRFLIMQEPFLYFPHVSSPHLS